MPSPNKEQNSSNGFPCNLDVNGKSHEKHSDCNGQKLWSDSFPSTNIPRQRVNVGKLKDWYAFNILSSINVLDRTNEFIY